MSDLVVVPANEATWEDLQAVFGERGDPSRCQCQRFKLGNADWTPVPVAERAATMRDETCSGNASASTTTGLLAYLDGEPVGWCAVEPRTAYPRLLDSRSPVVWKGRTEDRADGSVWAVTCFVTRVGFRRRGVMAGLVLAAVPYARSRGARALEGYPMDAPNGKDITWGELFVGARSAFEDAGFVEVSRPTLRRSVMRLEL